MEKDLSEEADDIGDLSRENVYLRYPFERSNARYVNG